MPKLTFYDFIISIWLHFKINNAALMTINKRGKINKPHAAGKEIGLEQGNIEYILPCRKASGEH